MNGGSVINQRFFEEFRLGVNGDLNCDFLICPPNIYLSDFGKELSRIGGYLGAQDVSAHDVGAYTGEVAASMLADVGCHYVIVGHSERRTYHGETDEVVAQKTIQALRAGIVPIVCVGESLKQHEAGLAIEVVTNQLNSVLDVLDRGAMERLVVSYEPLWAIGTGKTASPEVAQDVHSELRKLFFTHDPLIGQKVRILYGGSMKSGNAASLLAMPDIDGGLIGGASLSPTEFLAIMNSVDLV